MGPLRYSLQTRHRVNPAGSLRFAIPKLLAVSRHGRKGSPKKCSAHEIPIIVPLTHSAFYQPPEEVNVHRSVQSDNDTLATSSFAKAMRM